jgi:hypothetical protein
LFHLDAVVADRGGGVDGLIDVPFLEDALRLLRVVGPDPREEIGLQLDSESPPRTRTSCSWSMMPRRF